MRGQNGGLARLASATIGGGEGSSLKRRRDKRQDPQQKKVEPRSQGVSGGSGLGACLQQDLGRQLASDLLVARLGYASAAPVWHPAALAPAVGALQTAGNLDSYRTRGQ